MNIIQTNHTTLQPEIGDFEDYYFDFEEKKTLRIVQKDLGIYNKKTGRDVYVWKIQHFFTWLFRGLTSDQNVNQLGADETNLNTRYIPLLTAFNNGQQFDFNKQLSTQYDYKTYPLMRYQNGFMFTNNRMNGLNVDFVPLQHQLLFIFVKGVKGMIDENGKHTEIVGIAKFDPTQQQYVLIQSNIFETDQDSEIEIYLKFKKYVPIIDQSTGRCNGTYNEYFEFYSPEEEYYRYYSQFAHQWQGPPIYKSQITIQKFLLKSDDSDDDD